MAKKKKKYQYLMIDGNWTWFPCAWCKAKKGCLTKKIMETHKCKEKNCRSLDESMNFE